MFFGIGSQEMTLEEIGDKFQLTRERVRQIKEKLFEDFGQDSLKQIAKKLLRLDLYTFTLMGRKVLLY